MTHKRHSVTDINGFVDVGVLVAEARNRNMGTLSSGRFRGKHGDATEVALVR